MRARQAGGRPHESQGPTEHILRLFSLAERVSVLANGEVIRVFPPELTELQRQILDLLGVPASAYLAKS